MSQRYSNMIMNAKAQQDAQMEKNKYQSTMKTETREEILEQIRNKKKVIDKVQMFATETESMSSKMTAQDFKEKEEKKMEDNISMPTEQTIISSNKGVSKEEILKKPQ